MATQTRQGNLFAGEDWKQFYAAFSNIDLTSYDYDTIRQSMVDYISTTYPDSFNDWIENNEFIFILDTVSLLGQNLAFRMDLNSRENFLDTAERRASILRLAKMLSYSPKRAYPARGLAKITEITTNQEISNSSGKSLRNVAVRWNDTTDSDWYENFILVMNSVLISSNQFGDPIKKIVTSPVTNYIYRMNTVPFTSPAIGFNANVNGETMLMEVVNPDIDSTGVFVERNPNPQSQHNIIYRNDGNGFGSGETGFFVYVKQGTLSYVDYQFDQAIENRSVDVNINDINELDVWCNEVTNDGIVRAVWTKVPSIDSVSYTSVNRTLKTIFSVTTRDNDQITLRFPDGRSGEVPKGIYRIWNRVSNGKTYTIKTSDIQDKKIQYPYRTSSQSTDQQSILTIKFSLQFQIQNALEKETETQIKARAPQNYYLQNRVVTGEDYNIAPEMLGNAVLKTKAINRLYSGQSRFIDINDATGKYQNTDVFADDGAIYRDEEGATVKSTLLLPTDKDSRNVVVDNIQPLIGTNSVIQRYQEYPDNTISESTLYTFTSEYNSAYTSGTYGYLTSVTGTSNKTYDVSTLLQFTSGDGSSTVWTSVIDVISTNGYIVLSEPVTTGWTVKQYIKPFRTKFSSSEITLIASELDKQVDFILYYNPTDSTWNIEEGDFSSVTEITVNGSTYPIFVECNFNASEWDFISYGVQYVFIGGDKVKFYFVSTEKIADISTGTVQSDQIEVLPYNNNPFVNTGYTSSTDYQIINTLAQDNGYIDGSRAIVTSSSLDTYGVPLNPNMFRTLVPAYTGTSAIKYSTRIYLILNDDYTIDYVSLPNSQFTVLDSSWIYTIQNVNAETNAYQKAALARNVSIRSTSMGDLYNKGTDFVINFNYNGTEYYIKQTVGNNNDRLSNFITNMTLPSDTSAISPELAFYRAIVNTADSTKNANVQLSYYGYVNVSNQYMMKTDARVDINFHWKHYAPDDNRIDPTKTNLMDMYVLTTAYRAQVTDWINADDGTDFPKPPTSAELKEMFSEVETKIVVSDSAIWHSARYFTLFGPSADESYKASFKVVKAPNTALSDDEIKQMVIEYINDFFDISNWDFGESFFYTELSAYIHQQLATDISTIVLVPNNPNNKFGNLFEIPCESDQLFISTATVDNVSIVSSLSQTNMNIGS